MAIYRYPHESLVDSVQILTNEKGGQRAYLYADNGADTEKLRTLKQALRAQGYKCVPTLNDGKPVLEVRGFKKADELMGYLGQMRATTGKAEFTAEVTDKLTGKAKLANSTLKLAGISYNVGDAAYMYYAAGPILAAAVKTRKFPGFFSALDVVGALGYTMGSFCLTFFGSKDQSINTITEATSKIERFTRKEGYQIPPESSIAFANHEPNRGMWGNLKHLIGRYPSESLNSIYVGVGICLSAASIATVAKPVEMLLTTKKGMQVIETAILEAKNEGLVGKKLLEATDKAYKAHKATTIVGKEAKDILDKDLLHVGKTESGEELLATEYARNRYKENKRQHFWDKTEIGLGTVTAASAITGLVVKEQKRLDGDPKRHGVGGVIDWIREKPLRATGIGYMIATGFHAVATAGKWQNRAINGTDKKFLIGRVIFIGANIFSETMLAVSSKGHGVGVKPDSSINDSVISTASELVLRQPHEKREAIINQLSGYIASPDVLAIKAEDVEKSIRQHIAELDKNPWTKHYVSNGKGDVLEVKETASGEKIAVTPEETPAAPTPTNNISERTYVAKQQPQEHALA